jgi:hypothetical protein
MFASWRSCQLRLAAGTGASDLTPEQQSFQQEDPADTSGG